MDLSFSENYLLLKHIAVIVTLNAVFHVNTPKPILAKKLRNLGAILTLKTILA